VAATRLQLRDRAKARGDFEVDANIPDATWNTWLDQDYRRLWQLVALSDPDHFTAGPTEFTLSGSTDTFDLNTLTPAFWRLRGVDFKNSNDWIKVPRFTWEERNRLWRRQYRIMDTNLRFIPEGDAAGDYRVWWVPEPTAFANDSAEIDPAVSMYDDFIILSSAIRGRSRQEKSTNDLRADLKQVTDTLQAAATDRDQHEPDRVSDVDTAFQDELLFRRRA